MKKRKDYLILLLLLLVGLSVGYALLQTDLKINGSSIIKGSSWNIHFDNLNVTNGSVELSTGDVAASIQSTNTDINYTITLNTPGDYYEFTVDAVNAGTVDGMVESITSKLNNEPISSLPLYLNYSVSYSDGKEIGVNHLLKAGKRETYKVRIEFKRDIDNNDLPTSAQTLSLNFGVVYVQADSNGVEVVHLPNGMIYTVNKLDSNITGYNAISLNKAYPETIPYFETQAEALNAFLAATGENIPFYLKHRLENRIATESYIEFVVTETMAETNPGMIPGTYSLRGEKTSDKPSDYISSFYESNKEAVMTAFGYTNNPSRCRLSGTGRGALINCEVPSMKIVTYATGAIRIDSNDIFCNISVGGYASCSW